MRFSARTVSIICEVESANAVRLANWSVTVNKSREEMSIVALRVNASFIPYSTVQGKEILGWPAGIDFHGFSVSFAKPLFHSPRGGQRVRG